MSNRYDLTSPFCPINNHVIGISVSILQQMQRPSPNYELSPNYLIFSVFMCILQITFEFLLVIEDPCNNKGGSEDQRTLYPELPAGYEMRNAVPESDAENGVIKYDPAYLYPEDRPDEPVPQKMIGLNTCDISGDRVHHPEDHADHEYIYHGNDRSTRVPTM